MLKHRVLLPIFLVGSLAAVVFALFASDWSWLLLLVFLGLSLTAWGAFDIRLGYFTPTFYRKRRPSSKTIALTFDDGPTPFTLEILDLLKAHDAKATFFCIGRQIEAYPDVLRRIVREGHGVANHTATHPNSFGFLNSTQVVQELRQCDSTFEKILGKVPLLFRPPFGVTNPSVAKAVKTMKRPVVGWNNRSLDTVVHDEEKIYSRVLRKLKAGDIILFHDTSQRTVHVVKRLLEHAKAEGYACVSVDDLLNLQRYES